MKKFFLIIGALFAMATVTANAAENVVESKVVKQEQQEMSMPLDEMVTPTQGEQPVLPPPPPGHFWVVTTCASYLVPASMFPTMEALLLFVQLQQHWCDMVAVSPQ